MSLRYGSRVGFASCSRLTRSRSGPSATTSTAPNSAVSNWPARATDSASSSESSPVRPTRSTSLGSSSASSRTHRPFHSTSGCLSATISANSTGDTGSSPIATSHRNCLRLSPDSPPSVIPAPGSVAGWPTRRRARSRRAPLAVSSAGRSTPRPDATSAAAPWARKSAAWPGFRSNPVGCRSDRLPSIGGNRRAASASPLTSDSCGSPRYRPSSFRLSAPLAQTWSAGTMRLGSSAACSW